MNRFYRLTVCLAFLFGWLQTDSAQAQFGDNRKQGYWMLGLNAGAAWQNSDLAIRPGGGLGFYLGKNLYYRKERPISFDLRFRYLHTTSYGQDYRRTAVNTNNLLGGDVSFFASSGTNQVSRNNNYANDTSNTFGNRLGYVYMNNRTTFNDFALEGAFNFENLRRKYRIWASLYGGLGIGIYNVAYDQLAAVNTLGGLNTTYQYENIDQTQASSAVVRDIEALRDFDYETPFASGKTLATLTPSLGFELGYWITPNFALGIGHRVTWTLRDDFDGFESAQRKRNDVHHYANLFLKWRIGGRANGNISIGGNAQVTIKAPTVVMNYPNCPSVSNTSTTAIRITLTDIIDVQNITFMVNNQRVSNLSYNVSTGILEGNISLSVGLNTIYIRAFNATSSVESSCNITYNPPAVENPPTVIINTPSNGATLTTRTTAVSATVTNIKEINQIVITLNGQIIRNFTFNAGVIIVPAWVLTQGSNTVVITVTNTAGTSTNSSTVIHNPAPEPQPQPEPQPEPQPQPTIKNPPTVDITFPANGSTTNNPTTDVTATIRNISTANQITFTMNGQSSRNFSFSGRSFTAYGMPLQSGNNTIVITATNNDGTASDQTTIIYQAPRTPEPTVKITFPANGTVTSQPITQVLATIRHVTGANNVTFTINGQSNRNFSFSGTSFTANGVGLQQGNNTIVITGSNDRGTAQDQTTIIYQFVQPEPQPVPQPPTVRITSPANGSSTQTPTAQVNASIRNISSANQIRYTVNGQTLSNFNYNGGVFSSFINLQQGANTIVISATNNDGTASDQTTVIYQAPAPVVKNPPTVRITSPANGSSTQTPTAQVNASIQNISNANQIRYTVNGQTLSNFNYNGGVFSSFINLQQGNNTIVISATNNDGTATDQTTIIYQAPVRTPEPTVNISFPQNGSTTSQPITQVLATIRHVSRAEDVTFTVNGQSSRNFSFNGTSFTANGVNLQQGNNTIVITGSNERGTAQDQTTIIYQVAQPQPQPQRNPPTVRITAPANGSSTQTPTAQVNASVQNISSANQIRYTVNGQPINTFNFNGGMFSSFINLQQGANTIVISATNNDGTASDQTTVIYQAPAPVVKNPPTVRITAPANGSSTQTPTAQVNASVQNISNVSQIRFTVNGQPINTFNYNGGMFSAFVNLQQGNNTIVITATNNDGTATDQTMVIYQAPVRTPEPTVNISFPQNGSTVSQTTTQVNATIRHVSRAEDVTFTVNGQSSRNFSFSGTNFTANGVNLQQGNNTIVITGSNERGTAQDQTTVIYQAPAPVVKNPPTVQITAPAAGSATEVGSTQVTAVIRNISNSNQIQFTVNGQNGGGFNFNNGNFSANINLQQGANTIAINATNNDGTASDRTDIFYKKQVQPAPTVQITSPANGSTLNQANTQVTAVINHVSNAGSVQFTVNGQPNRNFSLNGTNFTANGVNLRQGNNTIVIVGTNESGTAQDQTNVIYQMPTPAPQVKITNPSQDPFVTYQAQGTVQANIKNVSNRNELSFTINGQTVDNFSFNGNTLVAENLSLTRGNNQIVITATNQGGTASDRTTIELRRLSEPTVRIVNPNTNPVNTTNTSGTFQAETSQVLNQSDVQVKVNGQNIPFSFDPASGRVQTQLRLNQGANTIEIFATNERGTASARTVINVEQAQPQPQPRRDAPQPQPQPQIEPKRDAPQPQPQIEPRRSQPQPQPQPQPEPRKEKPIDPTEPAMKPAKP